MTAAAISNPVFATQATFRALLDAMARPGTIHTIEPMAAPSPLSPTAAAVARTLCDHDTPLWLDDSLGDSTPVLEWLRFHCGSPIAGAPRDATFAFISAPPKLLSFAEFSVGTPDYPDRAATIVFQVASLRSGPALTLTGPGIPKQRALQWEPQPLDFADCLAVNRAHFPCGVDLLLVADGEVAALPRSVRVVKGNE